MDAVFRRAADEFLPAVVELARVPSVGKGILANSTTVNSHLPLALSGSDYITFHSALVDWA